ncbi:diguanylate cyclase domain-containing protein [Marinobacter mobilis]|uniref:diguanylate cyclase n=1 Tax=Marinobacter mobilis TaxID=488533 RepID=A0A1H3E9H8_9GAMM|nr:diguanylate cyclase [Marinobacter mobilis]SDX75267.1 response regulator receiver modulated diguanylate cyclase [Marinobacter mobilis]
MINSHPSSEVLIIDDDSSVILGLKKVLSDIGRIKFATSAEQAFEIIQEGPPDLILLDVGLPDVSGLEVCARLKSCEGTKKIPVIIITSNSESGFEEEVFAAGAVDYISKPLKPAVVLARTKIHLAYQTALRALVELAHTDELTGLENRRSFDERLECERKRAIREGTPLTVMMMDVDEFKKYNDHYGHLKGDDCLKSISLATARCCQRPGDFAARFGGEEFALILPGTGAEGAQSVAETIREHVHQLLLPHAPNASHTFVSLSVGSCTLTKELLERKEWSGLAILQAADNALYEAKANGRDCYRSATLPDLSAASLE